MLVVSAGMYNKQPSIPTVLTMPVIAAELDESWLFAQHLRSIDVQALTDVNNALFRILSTSQPEPHTLHTVAAWR